MRINTIFLISLVFLTLSCGNKNNIPNDILPPEKMRAVLWDVIKAESLANEWVRRDSSRNFMEQNAMLQKDIFVIHKISKQSFQKSFNFYKSRPSIMNPLMDSLTNKAYQSRPVIKPIVSVTADSL